MSNENEVVNDPWSTDQSSGFLRNFIGTVEDSFFATSPTYNSGTTLLMNWELTVDEALDEVDEVPETIDNKYPCGTGWATEDGGRTAEHSSGSANKRFHASSLYGKIIDEATGATKGYGNATLAADGSAVVTNFDGLIDVLRERGNPTVADVWKGLRFRFAEVKFDYGTDKKTGQAMTSVRAMPVEFLGVGGEQAAEKPAPAPAKKAAAKKAAAPAVDKVAEAKAKAEAAKKAKEQEADGGDADPAASLLASIDGGLTDETRDAILAVLAESEDFQTFQDACLEIDGVIDNDALLAVIVDDTEGLWATKG